MVIELTVIISVISVSAAIFFGIKSNKRASQQEVRDKTKDAAAEAANTTAILVKLEAIGTGVTEIKSELKAMKIDVKEITERLVAVEQSTKSAHKRLDDAGVGRRVIV